MNPESNHSRQIVWLNGRFLPADQALISAFDRGFLYGDGVFETIRAEAGRLLYLEDHLERMNNSLERLGISLGGDIDWEGTLADLIERNGLSGEVAVVKIVVSRGVSAGPGLPAPGFPTVLLSAAKYLPPDEAIYRRGWRLHLFREGFSPPLAGHKTLNYLYYCTARQSALDQGADEALLLDPSGRITETSAGSLLLRTNGRWWTPESPWKLPGTTLRRLSELLKESGSPVEVRQAGPEELFAAETVWMLNSLMLIMPVSAIDGRPVPDCMADEAGGLRGRLTEPG